MEYSLNEFYTQALHLLPNILAILSTLIILFIIRHFLGRRYANQSGKRYQHQLIMFLLYIAALLLIIIALPISENLRGQLLSLIGIIISATIALSSTTFVGNAMAGIMLRTLKNFRVGDFLMVENYFGRVSDTGLLHVEIQTEDRDLMTIPNLYLVTHPTKVILASGTIITAQISLGYEYPWKHIENLMLQAAADTGLEDPFVQLVNLGDFSVTYQINGMLTNVKLILSTRSMLRKSLLDRLHGAGIEIVSPTFMNTRAYPPDSRFMPSRESDDKTTPPSTSVPEDIVFDIAEEAQSLEKLRERLEEIKKQIHELKSGVDGDKVEEEKARQRIERLNQLEVRLTDLITRREEEASS